MSPRSRPPRWVAWLVAALVGACGRIGYDEEPATPSGKPDASAVGPSDASSGGLRDGAATDGRASSAGGAGTDGSGAGGAVPASGGVDGGGTGGTTSAGGATSSPTDAGADAAHDAGPSPDASCPLQPLADWCSALPELPGAPIIDGRLDCGLELRTVTPVAWNGPGVPDARAQYAIAWRPDGLYVFVAVTDPAVIPAAAADWVWEGDSVELYVDADASYAAPPAYDNPGTRQFVIAPPGDVMTDAATGTRGAVYLGMSVLGGTWTSSQFDAHLTATGYVVEEFVTAADLGLATWTLAAAQAVGFDLGVNVSYATAAQTGAAGHRLGQYFLHVDPAPTGEPYRNVTAFCNPTLMAR